MSRAQIVLQRPVPAGEGGPAGAPEVREVEFEGEPRLVELCLQAGAELEQPCGGEGTCGRCAVRVVEGPYRRPVTEASLPSELASQGWVLACQTHLLGDATVEVVERGGEAVALGHEDTVLLSQRLLPSRWAFEPVSQKHFLRVPPPTVEDNFSDMDRVARAIEEVVGKDQIPFGELELLRELPAVLRAAGGEITVGLLRFTDTYTLVNIQAGNRVAEHYGIACDIGTTTVAVDLVDLGSGEVLGTEATLNRQARRGEDVISRIQYAQGRERLEELRDLVSATIDELVARHLERHGIEPRDVTNAIFTGNPTMIHLLLAIEPRYLREEPYVPALRRVPQFKAWELELTNINPHTRVVCAPGVGSYVGGDVTAGLLCVERGEEVMAYLDIGTNGELVVGNRDWLLACACSAGPAFEGGGIRHGTRARAGAIERVRLADGGREVEYETVGGKPPVGICGSALIELVGALFDAGVLDRSGRYLRDEAHPRLERGAGGFRFRVVDAEASATGEAIALEERDVQSVVRAKAAIFAALRILLGKVGLGFEDLSRFYIAGGFGRFLNIEHAVRLGLLPDIERARFQYIGNASLTGGYLCLLSRQKRREIDALADSMTYVELSVEPGYMDEYTAALFLPHTDRGLFPGMAGDGEDGEERA